MVIERRRKRRLWDSRRRFHKSAEVETRRETRLKEGINISRARRRLKLFADSMGEMERFVYEGRLKVLEAT